MLETIIQATENFCTHQIRTSYTLDDKIPTIKTLISCIDIDTTNGEQHRVYIASDTKLMQRIAFLYLEEKQSDDETLIDMSLETTNLLVGSAKVIAEEANTNTYTIRTPKFEKIDNFDFEYDEIKHLKIQDDNLIIAIKKL